MPGKQKRGIFSFGFIFVISLICLSLAALWIMLAQPTLRSSPPSDIQVSAENLEKHVRMLSEQFVPRNAAAIANMNRTADYIKAEFEKAGKGTVSEQWYQVGSYRYRNVSLIMGDPTAPRVVIGAHYDGYGPHPGADDNASGVAGLIELAKLIADHPPKTAIEFVGYPLEEPPYFATSKMGSSKHVGHLRKNGIKCKYMISLEMIGYFTDERGTQHYPIKFLHLFYPEKGNFITVVGNNQNRSLTKNFKIAMKGATELPVVSICGPAAIPGIDFSDHRNYWHAGIPALMITDTAFYRNTAYHTPRDTADRLNYTKMAMVVTGVYEGIQKLDLRSGGQTQK